MVEEVAVHKLRERYRHINPIMFNRSCTYAKSLGELFDILECIPTRCPIIWDDKKRRWVVYELDGVLTSE